MDVLLNGEIVNNELIIDLALANGFPTVLSNEKEIAQRATLCSVIQKNSIPQLSDVGVRWTEALTGNVSVSDIDSDIRNMIEKVAGTKNYYPYYTVTKNRIDVDIRRAT